MQFHKALYTKGNEESTYFLFTTEPGMKTIDDVLRSAVKQLDALHILSANEVNYADFGVSVELGDPDKRRYLVSRNTSIPDNVQHYYFMYNPSNTEPERSNPMVKVSGSIPSLPLKREGGSLCEVVPEKIARMDSATVPVVTGPLRADTSDSIPAPLKDSSSAPVEDPAPAAIDPMETAPIDDTSSSMESESEREVEERITEEKRAMSSSSSSSSDSSDESSSSDEVPAKESVSFPAVGNPPSKPVPDNSVQVTFDSEGWSDSSSDSLSTSPEEPKAQPVSSPVAEPAVDKLNNTAVFSESDAESESDAVVEKKEETSVEVKADANEQILKEPSLTKESINSSKSVADSSSDTSSSDTSSSDSSSSDSSSEEEEELKPKIDMSSSLTSLLRSAKTVPKKVVPVKDTPKPKPKPSNGPVRAFKNIFKDGDKTGDIEVPVPKIPAATDASKIYRKGKRVQKKAK